MTAMDAPTFFAPLGTISAGTLAMRTIGDRFVEALCRIARQDPDKVRADKARQSAADAMDILVKGTLSDEEEHQLTETVSQDLVNRFESYAPPFVYFGSHMGDGADFGFWPSHEMLDEGIVAGLVLELEPGQPFPQGLDIGYVFVRAPFGEELFDYKTGKSIWKL